MTPYFSCPFVYYGRSSMAMPQVQAPVMPMPQAPTQVMPIQQLPMPPVAPPTPPPMNPISPIMAPVTPPMPPVMPMQPMQMNPVMPIPITPVAPIMAPGMNEMGNEAEEIQLPNSTHRDPPPVLSNNPPTTNVSLFKELTAYPNYGNPSRNADILYTGTRGSWTFNIPPFLFVPGQLRAQIVIRAVLDDHFNVPVNQYSARIDINGTVVHTGRLNLEHGVPAGGIFNNWRSLTFNIPNLRRSNRVTIQNTSTAGDNDWIAFDWMELRLIPRF